MASITRDDMIDGLTEFIRQLHERGAHATTRMVGLAALMLRYFEDHRITPDVIASTYAGAGYRWVGPRSRDTERHESEAAMFLHRTRSAAGPWVDFLVGHRPRR
jgi:hypothetical protein